MAFTATTYWEVNTSGNDANGGGYDATLGPGTDYTYGAGATTISYTDLVIQSTTTQASSTLRPFVAADVGNILNVTAGTGFTVQRVQVVSVAGGIATFDKSLGTAASTGGTGTLGGALASPGMAGALHVGGNRIYIRAATYNITSASNNVSNGCLQLASGNSTTGCTRVSGYQTTRDDYGTRPLLQAGAITSATLISGAASANNLTVTNLIFDGNATISNKGVTFASSNNECRMFLCKAQNYANGIGFQGSNTSITAVGCEASGASFSNLNCLYCVGHDVGTNAFITGVNGQTYVNCIAYNITGSVNGFNIGSSQNANLINCLVYNNATWDGFNIGGSTNGHAQVINCLAVNCGRYGFNAANVIDGALLLNCAGYGNTTANVNNTNIPTVRQINFVACTANPLNNPGSQDFSLNSVSGGGSALRSAGFPAATGTYAFPGISTKNYVDIGPSQHQGVAGGYPRSRVVAGV